MLTDERRSNAPTMNGVDQFAIFSPISTHTHKLNKKWGKKIKRQHIFSFVSVDCEFKTVHMNILHSGILYSPWKKLAGFRSHKIHSELAATPATVFMRYLRQHVSRNNSQIFKNVCHSFLPAAISWCQNSWRVKYCTGKTSWKIMPSIEKIIIFFRIKRVNLSLNQQLSGWILFAFNTCVFVSITIFSSSIFKKLDVWARNRTSVHLANQTHG